jgi:hypothetical protein
VHFLERNKEGKTEIKGKRKAKQRVNEIREDTRKIRKKKQRKLGIMKHLFYQLQR